MLALTPRVQVCHDSPLAESYCFMEIISLTIALRFLSKSIVNGQFLLSAAPGKAAHERGEFVIIDTSWVRARGGEVCK